MNKSIVRNISVFLFACLLSFGLQANINIDQPAGEGKEKPNIDAKAGDCVPATAQTELNVNNVRTTLLAGGDLWWDLSNGKYEVPKVEPGEPSKHSLFAGALWIGGIDALGQLKVAAMTYRQTGNDFFPGPLDSNGEIERETCASFDRFWETGRDDIDAFLTVVDENEGVAPLALIPESILAWPGKNNIYFEEYSGFELPEDKQLAPFWDANTDGDYNPEDGDYPVIDPEIEGVYGDQMIWWVFNDKGNIHSETGGQAIGLEVSSLAFAFSTNDEVNNMTFYKYVVDNKSTADLNDTYFGQWVDPDLGNYTDDYVGCVPSEGLGIVYNGDALDDGTAGYGEEIPMLGVDFFKGPTVPSRDGTTDTLLLDEAGNQIFEELGMSSFLYYNNDFSVTGNPETATHFYNYLSGFWKDGTPFTCGDNGYGGAIDTCSYIFPDNPPNQDGWSECALDIQPADRRFLQVAGPFTLEPGAVNDVIVGVVWTREGVNYPCPSFEAIISADQQAQALFDSGFKLSNGPDAPNMTIVEANQQLTISLWNESGSNNYLEEYQEANAVLSASGDPDSLYTFQGYRVYQLANATVTPAEYTDEEKAKEIFQVDIEDGVTKIINTYFDSEIGVDIPEIMVNGTDNGIEHTFTITDDQFATGDKTLINHKPYFFSVVAYAHLPKEDWATPYLLGRNNITTYTAIPHKNFAETAGVTVNATYGDGPEITTISGFGNTANYLELTEETVDSLLNDIDGYSGNPTYQSGAGPVNVKIIDPYAIPKATFELSFEDSQFFSFTQPNIGTVEENGSRFTYTPDADATNAYTEFTYEIINESGITDLAYVSVINNNLADDNDFYLFSDSEVIDLDTATELDGIELDVLANDIIDNNSTPTFAGFTSPTRGTLTAVTDTTFIDNDPEVGVDFVTLLSFEYVPNSSDITGGDIFTYSLSQNGSTKTASVYINLQQSTQTGIVNAVDDQYTTTSPMLVTGNDESDLNGSAIITGGATWQLEVIASEDENLPVGRIYESEGIINNYNEQAIGGWERSALGAESDWQTGYPLGFTVGIRQAVNPDRGNGFIEASLTHTSGQSTWLDIIADEEGETMFNWIRSGDAVDDLDAYYYDQGTWETGSAYAYDENAYYEGILGGGIAPYSLVANQPGYYYNDLTTAYTMSMSPGCSDCYGNQFGDFESPTENLSETRGVDIIITKDKSLWSRCAVVELCRDCAGSEGGTEKNKLRNAPSLDIDGNEETGSTGMSYFPGYAIDVDTGERLNIMFGENSRLGVDNGNDMLWNPTSDLFITDIGGPGNGGINNFRAGGEHYVYVMKSNYDGCASLRNQLSIEATKKQAYDDAMWVMAPMALEGVELGNNGDKGAYTIPSDVEIKVRVSRSYEDNPVYRFDFTDLSPSVDADSNFAESALDQVQVVPNPYYAISSYESSKFENQIKITNLPPRANIRIFTLDGTLIRELATDNTGVPTNISTQDGTTENVVTWDLKNNRNIPIASGLYLINVEAPDYGVSKTLKWFGVVRPIDLETF